MTSVTHVTNQLCQHTALKFLPPLLQHAIHSFIHLFALSLISPSTVKVFFFVFRSISNTVNVNKPLSIFLHSTWHFCSRSAIWEEENDVNGEIMLGNTPQSVIPRYTKIYGCTCTSLLHYN